MDAIPGSANTNFVNLKQILLLFNQFATSEPYIIIYRDKPY